MIAFLGILLALALVDVVSEELLLLRKKKSVKLNELHRRDTINKLRMPLTWFVYRKYYTKAYEIGAADPKVSELINGTNDRITVYRIRSTKYCFWVYFKSKKEEAAFLLKYGSSVSPLFSD